jgi:cobalt/nickel transport system permease protein
MPPPGRSHRRSRFVRDTIAGLNRRLDRALFADELAAADGLLQKLDPRVKIISLLVLLLVVTAARNLPTIVIVFTIAFLLAVFSRIPVRTLALRVWLGAFVFSGLIALPAIFVTPGRSLFQLPLLGWPISAPGLSSALYLIARVETTVTLSMLLVLTTRWTKVLKALRVLRVPVVLVVILGMTHRYIFLLLQSARDMFESRESRTVGTLDGRQRRQLAAATSGVLLSKTLLLSTDVYAAMQSRGFRGEVYTLDDFKMRGRDWFALVIFLTTALILFWFGRQGIVAFSAI